MFPQELLQRSSLMDRPAQDSSNTFKNWNHNYTVSNKDYLCYIYIITKPKKFLLFWFVTSFMSNKQHVSSFWLFLLLSQSLPGHCWGPTVIFSHSETFSVFYTFLRHMLTLKNCSKTTSLGKLFFINEEFSSDQLFPSLVISLNCVLPYSMSVFSTQRKFTFLN